MRPLVAVLAISLLSAGQAFAECDCGYPQHRAKPCRRCVEKHVYIPVEPKQEEISRPEGGYAAPPQTGVFAGESAGVGLEGFEIELPKMTFKFPTIRFPRLTHYRQGPRMLVESAEAPWVESYRREASFEVSRPELGPPAPTQPEAAPKPCDLPPKPHCAQAELPADVDGQLASLEAQYAQRFQRLEEMEQRLSAKVQRLSRVLEQLDRLEEVAVATPPQTGPIESAPEAEPAVSDQDEFPIQATAAHEPVRLPVPPAELPPVSSGSTSPANAKPIASSRPTANAELPPRADGTSSERSRQAVAEPATQPQPANPLARLPQAMSQLGRNIFGKRS